MWFGFDACGWMAKTKHCWFYVTTTHWRWLPKGGRYHPDDAVWQLHWFGFYFQVGYDPRD